MGGSRSNFAFASLLTMLTSAGLGANAVVRQPEVRAPCSTQDEPVAIRPGEYIECSTHSVDQRDRYCIEGRAGDHVCVYIRSRSDGFDPTIAFTSPNGEPMQDPGCEQPLGTSCHCSVSPDRRCGFEVCFTLEVDGCHHITVRDAGSNEIGSYTLSSERIPPATALAALVDGRPVVESHSFLTDLDWFSFRIAEQTSARLLMRGRSEGLDPKIEIRNQDGSLVASAACSAPAETHCSVDWSPALAPGSYLADTREDGADQTGDYELGLHCLHGPCDADADGVADPRPLLEYGDPASGRIDSFTDIDLFEIQIVAGTRALLIVEAKTDGFDPRVALRDSSGAPRSAGRVGCTGSATDRCTSTTPLDDLAPGRYTLAIWEGGIDQTGDYALTLQCVAGDCRTETRPPGDNCPAVPNPGQIDRDLDGEGDLCEPGDANADGRVDGADYTIWADHFGRSEALFREGDFNSDGVVDGADYTIWADHFAPAAASRSDPSAP